MFENKEDYLLIQSLRVNALYNNAAIPVVVMLCGACGLTISLWNDKNSVALISWFITLIIITAIRCFIVWKYQHSDKRVEDYPSWLKAYFIGTLFSGVALGSTAFLVPTDNNIIEYGLITMFMLVVISGSIGIYSVFKRIYYALSLPAILPLILSLYFQDGEQMTSLCLITLIFTIFIFIIHYHSQKITNQLLLIKFDNKVLLQNYDTDQEKINILMKLNKTRSKQLERAQLELNSLKRQ
jgi:magnesium-transporting ATPase (P-type)